MNTDEYNKDSSRYSLKVTYDSNPTECNITSIPLIRGSKDVQDLEHEGYEVVFPEPLSEKAISKMSPQEREIYHEKLSLAMIINPQEMPLSLEQASIIAKHHYSCGPGVITGVDPDKNSLTIFPQGDFDEQAHVRLNEVFTKLGYPSQLNGIEIEVASSIPYPCVAKEKLREVFTTYVREAKQFLEVGKKFLA